MSRTITKPGFTLANITSAEKHALILDSMKTDKDTGAKNVGQGHRGHGVCLKSMSKIILTQGFTLTAITCAE